MSLLPDDDLTSSHVITTNSKSFTSRDAHCKSHPVLNISYMHYYMHYLSSCTLHIVLNLCMYVRIVCECHIGGLITEVTATVKFNCSTLKQSFHTV